MNIFFSATEIHSADRCYLNVDVCVNSKESKKAIIDNHLHPHVKELNSENYIS